MNKENIKIKDGYKEFFELFPKEDFLKFGLENIIPIPKEKAKNAWIELLQRINSKANDLYVRSSGRNGNGNEILKKLYKDVFGININFDPTNNNEPAKLLQELTGFKKNKTIFNYQVSHPFGNTKNVFCFTAPWNVVFIPKILDPFTGHEAKGDEVNEFTKKFKSKIYRLYEKEIISYNHEMKKYSKPISDWVKENVDNKMQVSIKKDFDQIQKF
jgi:hypothetical protein